MKLVRTSAIFSSLCLIILVVLFSGPQGFAQTATPTPTPTPDNSGKLDEVKNKIKELESKISSLQAEEKTLNSQITVMDSQIKLTELRISATEGELSELGADITTAAGKIETLEAALNDTTKLLVNRIISIYQVGDVQPMHVFLGSQNVSDFVSKVNYLKIVQEHDKRMIFDTQQAKNDYQNQKEIFEGKKQKVEELKAQLQGYTEQLNKDKKSKQDLLEVTKNDERKYQGLLASAIVERSAMEGAISSLQLKDGTPVSEGQVIAVVGNSGAPYCSTGPHLHFEVRKNGGIDDPSKYIRSGVNFEYSYGSDSYGYYGSVSPSGSWSWPLDETIVINQGYGSHGYARSFYPNGIHTGFDMESKSSSLIKAPKSGMLYKGTSSCSGAPMNYVAIDHGDGVVSWYFHVK